jgi:hypothetical protein
MYLFKEYFSFIKKIIILHNLRINKILEIILI